MSPDHARLKEAGSAREVGASPKDDTSDLGNSLATWIMRGPRGLQDFMCSTTSSLPVCGPVYVRSTYRTCTSM